MASPPVCLGGRRSPRRIAIRPLRSPATSYRKLMLRDSVAHCLVCTEFFFFVCWSSVVFSYTIIMPKLCFFCILKFCFVFWCMLKFCFFLCMLNFCCFYLCWSSVFFFFIYTEVLLFFLMYSYLLKFCCFFWCMIMKFCCFFWCMLIFCFFFWCMPKFFFFCMLEFCFFHSYFEHCFGIVLWLVSLTSLAGFRDAICIRGTKCIQTSKRRSFLCFFFILCGNVI